MATSVLKLLQSHLGTVALASSLFLSTFVTAQSGNAIVGYSYLGSCVVGGHPHYYYLSDAAEFWPIANTNAQVLGGYLATLTSAAENECVTNFVIAKTGTFTFNNGGSYQNINIPWIGYTDNTFQGTREGDWIWANGENCSDFTNWDVGEPNNFFSGVVEDYGTLLTFAGPKLGKWNDWFINWQNRYIVEFGPNPCCVPPPPRAVGNEGCSLGYWKNHPASWTGTGFSPNQTLESVWDVPDALGMDDFTLQQALDFGGGPGLTGGARNLFKQAVAALLNAASPDVDYPLSAANVIAMVNAALAQDRNAMLSLAGAFDKYNNLHGASICSEASSSDRAINPGNEVASTEKAFAVSGYPNPSKGAFSVQINGLTTETVSVKVTDATGRLVEQRTKVAANQVLSIGNNYNAGIYYIEVAQGAKKQQLKMVKQ